MSRVSQKGRTRPKGEGNCVVIDREDRHESAKSVLAKCKAREASKIHEVIIVNSKTYLLREIGDKPVKLRRR